MTDAGRQLSLDEQLEPEVAAPPGEPEPAPDRPEVAAPPGQPEPAPDRPETAAPPGEPEPAPDRPELTAEQGAAIAAWRRDALLEAGAGTGKTTVLVERYCAAVADDGVEVERVLAFTFTERAAAEMRSRIRAELAARSRAARAAGDAGRADELLRDARATERAWVMTIHAFCRRLLASHPLAAGLDPRFRVLDAPEAARLRDRAVDSALDALLATGDEEVARATAAYQAWRLRAMVIDVHARLRSHGMTRPRLPAFTPPIFSPGANGDPRALSAAEVEAATGARAAVERLLEEFDRRYEELKRERSALDFQDLELGALELLRGSRAVAAAWRGRFTHLLVDEFQDTNRVQLELVEALRGPDTRVFEVGDENQSIYRFRNADLEVFRAERRAALAAGDRDVLPLRGNFRSLPGVLAAVNEVGRVLLGGFAELTSGRDAAAGAGEVELLLTLDEGRARDARRWDADGIELEPPPGGSPPRIVAEARALAERLRELVDAGEAERREIVVLLRAFTHVDAYEEALLRAGLAPFVVGGRGYWTQQQVEDLVRLLGVVSNPLDEEHLFGALASFAAGVSPDSLWLLRRAARDERDRPRDLWPVLEWRFGGGREPREAQPHWLDGIPAIDAERLERFCGVLRTLRAEAPLLSLEELIERTMSAFGYDLGLIARKGGAGRMANVRKLMRLAREYEANEGRDLAGFLALAAASTRRDEREGMAAVQAEGHDGVRVMTVHAAKGLQFPTVAVPDLGRALNAGHRAGDLVIGAPREDRDEVVDPPGTGADRDGGAVEPPGAERDRDGGALDPRGAERDRDRASPDAGGERRFGMRLVFPSASSLGLWELSEINQAESAAEAEEGCRLVYVAASRAEDRLILSGVYRPSDLEQAVEPKPSDTPLRRLLPALGARGWEGGDATVGLPGPRAVDGSRLPDAELRIRVSEPGPRRATELIRAHRPPPQADPLAAPASPPLLDDRPSPLPVGHLSYSALASYERCPYRFYLERILGVREPLAAGEPAVTEEPESPGSGAGDDELPEPGVRAGEAAGAEGSRARALGVGNAVHAALEWSARNAWARPGDELLETIGSREGLAGDGEAAERVRALVGGWLGSTLLAELDPTATRPEVPFVLGLAGTAVRGQIDLLVGGGSAQPTLIDYKTDALHDRAPAELAARYRAQREVYALAAHGERGARAIHVFLEAPDEPVIELLDGDGLGAARARLESLLERMRGGDFEPAAEPYAALCFGCPAAARLCPRPAWHPRS